MHTFTINSQYRCQFIDITGQVKSVLQQNPVSDGACIVFVPHTTAAVTINENADPDVQRDLLLGLDRLASNKDYRHSEGNSDAHLKTSLLGSSQLIPIINGNLVLGTWQGIYLAEFDGPRQRKVVIQILTNLSTQ